MEMDANQSQVQDASTAFTFGELKDREQVDEPCTPKFQNMFMPDNEQFVDEFLKE